MRRALIAILIAAATAAFATAVASSGGHTADQLIKAGWECITPPNDNVHCTKTIEQLGTAERVTFRVFSIATGEYLGTEMLVHHDAFKGEPCPSDPSSTGGRGQYTNLQPILGIPYWACHRYDSPF